ncbi:MAG: DUF2007 domain-containing protein [bacterium]|nr:DUF2007 domain-containing protein [bacterium]
MNGKIALLKKFSTREEAEIAKGLLESNNIRVILKSDDASGFYPQMDLSMGVKLFVDESDLEEAKELLTSSVENQDEGN